MKALVAEQRAMLSALADIPPRNALSKCLSADQVAMFSQLRAQHCHLKGLLEDYFSGVQYRPIQGISALEQRFLKAELDKLLAIYDLLWWEWGELSRRLEAKGIYLQDAEIFGPNDALVKIAELTAQAQLSQWTGGYYRYSQKQSQRERAFFMRAFKLMSQAEGLRKPEKAKIDQAHKRLSRQFAANKGMALEFVLVTGARLVAEGEGRKSPTKRKIKRYMTASDRWLKLVRPYARALKSHQIVNGKISSA